MKEKQQLKQTSDHDRYVGALVNLKTITTNKQIISSALKLNLPIFWISKFHADFMAECDFGQKWKDLAVSPVILEDSKGVIGKYQSEQMSINLAKNFL